MEARPLDSIDKLHSFVYINMQLKINMDKIGFHSGVEGAIDTMHVAFRSTHRLDLSAPDRMHENITQRTIIDSNRGGSLYCTRHEMPLAEISLKEQCTCICIYIYIYQ